jgi:hypothetical protein
MSTVIEALAYGLEVGMGVGVFLVPLVAALEGIKSAVLDIMQGVPDNQTKEDSIR